MPTRDDLIYFAGLFDGDGCISASAETPRVVLNMCSKETVDSFAEAFQMTVSHVDNHNKGNRRDTWQARVSGTKALIVLQSLVPHLRLKKRQAEIAIEIISSLHLDKRAMSDSDLANRLRLCAEIRVLNRRGRDTEASYD